MHSHVVRIDHSFLFGGGVGIILRIVTSRARLPKTCPKQENNVFFLDFATLATRDMRKWGAAKGMSSAVAAIGGASMHQKMSEPQGDVLAAAEKDDARVNIKLR